MAIKYQQEFLHSVVEDIKPLLEEHWEEVALNKDKIKINPDWEAYFSLESQGKLDIFTARDEGVLVGYFVVFVYPHIHCIYTYSMCIHTFTVYPHIQCISIQSLYKQIFTVYQNIH